LIAFDSAVSPTSLPGTKQDEAEVFLDGGIKNGTGDRVWTPFGKGAEAGGGGSLGAEGGCFKGVCAGEEKGGGLNKVDVAHQEFRLIFLC